jgi:hypothetical protein
MTHRELDAMFQPWTPLEYAEAAIGRWHYERETARRLG